MNGRAVRWGLWFGLVGGLVEVLLTTFDQYYLGRVLHLGRHVTWMTPAAAGLISLTAGLATAAVARIIPRLPPALLIFGLQLPAIFGIVMFLHPRLHIYAGALLAFGIATQSTRVIVARQDAFDRFVRRALPLTLGLVVCLAAGVFGYEAWQARHSRAQLGPKPDKAPNVLLIVLDTVRAKSLSAYGFPLPTSPRLQQFAQAGVRFDQAFTTAPWTAPSHASMFTGQYPSSLSIGWREPLDDTYTTLAEALRGRGYVTKAFVGNTMGCTVERGLHRGFETYRDFPLSWQEFARSSAMVRMLANMSRLRPLLGWWDLVGRKWGPAVSGEFLAWLDQKPDRPFFVFLNYFDAHDPYLPPPPYDTMFGTAPRPNPWMTRRWWNAAERNKKHVPAELAAYHGAIAYLDEQIGQLLDRLRQRGVLDNTLVIITSDHGEEFLEHGQMGHARGMWEEVLRVPLVVSFPGVVPAGTVVREPVTVRDIPATIEDLLSLPRTGFAGGSLARHWAADAPKDEPILAHHRTVRSVVHGRWHYIQDGRKRERLFDLTTDPEEQHDLAGTPEGQALLPRLRQIADEGTALDRRSGPRKVR